jgi:hypothetical protein
MPGESLGNMLYAEHRIQAGLSNMSLTYMLLSPYQLQKVQQSLGVRGFEA